MNNQERMAIAAARHAEYISDPWKAFNNAGIPRSFAPPESELDPEPDLPATIQDDSSSEYEIELAKAFDVINARKLARAYRFMGK